MNMDNPVRAPHYTVVEDAVIEDDDLSGYGLLCYLAIRRHVDAEGICWPSIKKIAKHMRCSVRRAQDAIKELENLGYLEVDSGQGNGTSNVYVLCARRRGKQEVPRGSAPHAEGGRHHVPTEVHPVEVHPEKKESAPPAPAAVKAKSLFTKMKEITEERAGKWASGAKEGVSLSRLIAWAENNHNGNGERFLRDFLDGAWALHRGEVRGLRERDVDYWKAQPYTPSRLLSNAAAICAVLEHAADKQTVPVELRDIVGRPV